jgi:hypothetical protein
LKNGGKKVELVEGRSLEFAEQMVENTVAENMAKNQTIENLVEGRNSESAEEDKPELVAPQQLGIDLKNDTLLNMVDEKSIQPVPIPKDLTEMSDNDISVLLDHNAFSTRYQSVGPNLDMDSIYSMPSDELRTVIKAARERPTRIEFEQITVKSVALDIDNLGIKEMVIAEKLKNVDAAFYDPNLNLFRLCRYTADSIADKSVRDFVDAQNAEAIFRMAHELFGHAAEKDFPMGNLGPDQLVRNSIEHEIRGRLCDEALRMLVLHRTKSMRKAFPLAMYFLSKKYPELDLDSLFDMNSAENPLGDKAIYQSWATFPRYALWLFSNAQDVDPKNITRDHADYMFAAAIEDLNLRLRHYIQNGQIIAKARNDLGVGQSDLRKWRLDNAKGRPFFAPNYDEIMRMRYSGIVHGGNLMDMLNDDMGNLVAKMIHGFTQTPELIAAAEDFYASDADAIGLGEQLRQIIWPNASEQSADLKVSTRAIRRTQLEADRW